jgi:DNA-binding XRE family transcriptional regulator
VFDTSTTHTGNVAGESAGSPERAPNDLGAEAKDRFPTLFAAFRQRCGFSQNALARQASVSPSTINNLESGERHPTRVLTLQLARSLGLTPPQTDRLLVAARHAPTITDRLSPADPDLRLVATILADESLPLVRRDDFRAIIRNAAAFAGYVLPANELIEGKQSVGDAPTSAEVPA